MATSKALSTTQSADLQLGHVDILAALFSAALPVAAFVGVNALAEGYGLLPLFFAPFGLPGWVGGALHIGCLPLFGLARWMVVAQGPEGRSAARWIVALLAGMIAFPFAVMPLDSLMLSIVSIGLLLIGLGALVRAGAVDPRAGLVMAPGLAWMGVSAFVGLTFVASWSPPFAVTTVQGSASAS